mgnify:CR=1 FL=1
MGVPSAVSVDLVRRNKMGANKRRTRPKAAMEEKSFVSSFALISSEEFPLQTATGSVMAFRQNAAPHHGSCRRNFSRPYTSCNEF